VKRGVLRMRYFVESNRAPRLTFSFFQVEKVFSVPLDGFMDRSTMREIMERGYSRVPVHAPGELGILVQWQPLC